MENHNKQYIAQASNLYDLLSKKYNVQKGTFSTPVLNKLTFSLNRTKRLTHDETNKILNISRTVNWVEHESYAVSQVELKELEEIYTYFRQIDKNKESKTSKLEFLFKKLSMQSKDAIINENEFNEFKEYMHIKRPIEKEFEEALRSHVIAKNKSILFIVGNVGDGKSHLLSYMMKKNPDIFNHYQINIHNDATETDSPTSTAIETMKRVLAPFSDERIEKNETNRLIVAINLGILTNLIRELEFDSNFNGLVDYLKASRVLSSRTLSDESDPHFKILSFTEHVNFHLTNDSVKSDFYEEALQKIFSKRIDNPFYQAYKEDKENGMTKLLHSNYSYMLREDFQKSIIYLLIRAEIEHKVIISARLLFNFLFDITMPRDEKSSFNSYLPYLLFDNASRSEILTVINNLDPIKNQTRKIDEISIELYHAPNTLTKISQLLGQESETFYGIFQSFKDKEEDFNNFINTYLRIRFLMDYNNELFNNELFKHYLHRYFLVQEGEQVIELFELVNSSFLKWNGEVGMDGYVIRNAGKGQVKILVEVNLIPISNHVQGTSVLLTFGVKDSLYTVEIDYKTYEVLIKLNKGYFLKQEDRQVAIKFEVFVNEIIDSVKEMNKNILLDTRTQEFYELRKFMNKVTLKKGMR